MDKKHNGFNIGQNGSSKTAWQTPMLEIRPAKSAEQAANDHPDHESYMGSFHENWHAH